MTPKVFGWDEKFLKVGLGAGVVLNFNKDIIQGNWLNIRRFKHVRSFQVFFERQNSDCDRW